MKTRTVTKYITDNDLELNFKPFDDNDVIITEKDGKIYVRYLVQDENPVMDNPNDCSSPDLFLVFYHRQCDIRNDRIITENEVRDYYLGNKLPAWDRKYWIYKLNAYIHSGVVLGLAPTNFPDERWDVSHNGLVLLAKKVWLGHEAKKIAELFIKEWNQYLSGDIWGMCTDVFDAKTKENIIEESEALWGGYGYNDCLKQLKEESEA